MEKLMIIGAGIGQIPLIDKAKKRGIHVTVVSIPGNYPGFALADDIIYCDIYDRDKLVDIARENKITSVLSDQNDLMMPTVAFIAEHLGLPGNRFSQVQAYCNKNTFRTNCDLLGIPVPRHVEIKTISEDLKKITFPLPWMVKPADSQSSIGVCKVESEEEAIAALQIAIEKAPSRSAIVEQYFVGHEVVCEGFIIKGQYYLLNFADRIYFNLGNLSIPSQTLFPSDISQSIKDRIVRCEEKMAKYINPSFAIVHAEWLINDSGEICAVESALRGGGVYISSHLIPFSTGIDINDVLLDFATGKTIDPNEIISHRQEAAAGYVCFYLPEGTITEIKGIEALNNLPFVRMVALSDLSVGQKTNKMTYKGQRLGPILVTGKNRTELNAHIEIIKQTLQISVVSPEGEKKEIIWY